jgi:hypothetical protein
MYWDFRLVGRFCFKGDLAVLSNNGYRQLHSVADFDESSMKTFDIPVSPLGQLQPLLQFWL